MASKEDIQQKIQAIEARMALADFWADKDVAQATIKELQNLKELLKLSSEKLKIALKKELLILLHAQKLLIKLLLK